MSTSTAYSDADLGRIRAAVTDRYTSLVAQGTPKPQALLIATDLTRDRLRGRDPSLPVVPLQDGCGCIDGRPHGAVLDCAWGLR